MIDLKSFKKNGWSPAATCRASTNKGYLAAAPTKAELYTADLAPSMAAKS